MVDMDDIQCRAAREKSLHQAGVGTCALAWQAGFFFDGMRRNINQDSDTNRLSNVSRLFRAYPLQESMDLDSSYLYSAIYISGLGTPYEDQAADRLHSAMDNQQKALLDDALDSAAGQAKEAAADALYDANKKDWFDTLSHNLSDLFSITSVKAALTDTAQGIAKKVTLEALPSLRDHPMVMEQFMTGVDARINGAKSSFKNQFASLKAKNQLPIKLIQISVFGADLGGILARRFIDELLEQVCTKEGDEYRYEGAKVELTFAGLFDCSRRSSLDSGETMADAFSLAGLLARPIQGPLEWIGGPKVIDFDKPLHSAVKKALHLVAAHERRVYRPLVPLGELDAGWREELLPGISEDITGGLVPNEQRPSAELCRVALHEMYNAARSGEVPFPNFNILQEIDPLVAAYFVMHDNLAGKSVRYYSRRYMQSAGDNKPSRQAFERHQEIYSEWLGRQYADYKARWSKASLEERAWLKERWGWLGFVRDEARYVERAVANPNGFAAYVQGSKALKMAKTFLYPPLRAFPEDVSIFFAYFMHDFVSSTAFTTSPTEQVKIKFQSEALIGSHHFFLPRGIETLKASDEGAFSLGETTQQEEGTEELGKPNTASNDDSGDSSDEDDSSPPIFPRSDDLDMYQVQSTITGDKGGVEIVPFNVNSGKKSNIAGHEVQSGKTGFNAPRELALELNNGNFVKDLSSSEKVSLIKMPSGSLVVVKEYGANEAAGEAGLLYQEYEAKTEEAAYEISNMFGHRYASRARVAEAESGYNTTVVIDMIDTKPSGKPPTHEARHNAMDIISDGETFIDRYKNGGLSVFDYIIGHSDRSEAGDSFNNILIDKNGAFISIDHDSAFKQNSQVKLYTDKAIVDFFDNDTAQNAVSSASFPNYLKSELGIYRELHNGPDIDATIQRFNEVLSKYQVLKKKAVV